MPCRNGQQRSAKVSGSRGALLASARLGRGRSAGVSGVWPLVCVRYFALLTPMFRASRSRRVANWLGGAFHNAGFRQWVLCGTLNRQQTLPRVNGPLPFSEAEAPRDALARGLLRQDHLIDDMDDTVRGFDIGRHDRSVINHHAVVEIDHDFRTLNGRSHHVV